MNTPRKTLSIKQRTHARLIALSDGFDDSADKILNRLIDYWHKGKKHVKGES
jgi:hypothetical protein